MEEWKQEIFTLLSIFIWVCGLFGAMAYSNKKIDIGIWQGHHSFIFIIAYLILTALIIYLL